MCRGFDASALALTRLAGSVGVDLRVCGLVRAVVCVELSMFAAQLSVRRKMAVTWVRAVSRVQLLVAALARCSIRMVADRSVS